MKYLYNNRFNVLTLYNLRYNNTNSIARNNIINNQENSNRSITAASNNNEVYNNAISKSSTSIINVKAGSSGNKIYNNIIDNTQDVGINILNIPGF
jgi:hypothetical protein